MAQPGLIERAGQSLRWLAKVVASIAIVLMLIHVLANVIGRYFIRNPIEGTLEYTGFWYLPILVFLGIYLAQAAGSHISAGILFNRFPRPVQIEAHIAGELLTALLIGGFGWFGWREALQLAEIKATAGATTVIMWPAAFIVPLACVLVVGQILFGLYDVLRTRNPNVVSERAIARANPEQPAPAGGRSEEQS